MNDLWMTFAALVIAQVFFQYYCQPSRWLENRKERGLMSLSLIKHSLVQGIVGCCVLAWVTLDAGSLISLFLLLALSHWVIDAMVYLMGFRVRVLLVAQALHSIILLLLAIHVHGIELLSLWDGLIKEIEPKHLAVVIAYLLVLKPTSSMISALLATYSPINREENEGLIAGGEIIGYLERLLMLTFVLVGQYAVIGFILAAKSIFRFGELNKASYRNLTEYVLLGSLLSVTTTSLIGLLAKMAL
ncbi:DUF3307 domain-containing protein [Psychrobium sp. nBUS_13]|uniref:DUF3307 domain-containing protein n=1 Tax=Psychrobium sp. nBUS_13 TaxID=3395319 RepID=UPI003EBA8777